MAISYIGSKTKGNSAVATSIAIDGPTTVAVGDLMLWRLGCQAPSLVMPAVPSGWLSWQADQTNGNNGVGRYYRFATSADVANIGVAGAYSISGLTSGKYSSTISIYRGVNQTTPKDVANVVSTSGTTFATPAAITPSTPGAWIVMDEEATTGSGSAPPSWTSANLTALVAEAHGTVASNPNPNLQQGYFSGWVSGAFTANLASSTGSFSNGFCCMSALLPDTVAVTLADTGTGTDRLVVGPRLAETGAGTDALTVAASVPLADTATGTDVLALIAHPALSETGTGTDALTVEAAIALADTGHIAEAMTVELPDEIQFMRNTPAISRAHNRVLDEAEPATDGQTIAVGPIGGGVGWNALAKTLMEGPPTIRTVTVNTLIGIDDQAHVVVGNGTSITVTLPDPATVPGRRYWVKNTNASNLTVATASSSIDGGSTLTLAQWAHTSLVSDGTNWLTI